MRGIGCMLSLGWHGLVAGKNMFGSWILLTFAFVDLDCPVEDPKNAFDAPFSLEDPFWLRRDLMQDLQRALEFASSQRQVPDHDGCAK